MTLPIRMEKSTEHRFVPGLTRTAGGYHMAAVSGAKELALRIYRENECLGDISFPEDSRTGRVWEMQLSGDFSALSYTLLEDGKETEDPFGREFQDAALFGDPAQVNAVKRAGFPGRDYDWEGDKNPGIPFKDTIIYRLHPRGFTRAGAPGVPPRERGTFAGIRRLIPYLSGLGFTAAELMPSCEFREVMTREQGIPGAGPVPSGYINYWGYGTAYRYFAPKAAYTAGDSPVSEMKDLVKAFHRAGLEIYLDFWFKEKENPLLIREVCRFWKTEYHVDGFRFSGPAEVSFLASDPVLSGTKLFAPRWDVPGEERGGSLLAEYDDGFRNDMRHVLRGDEGWLSALIYRTRHIPETGGIVNYLANTNGFTLADLVSYEKRHNEENGEENRDGETDNLSDNCGAEGPSKKKAVRELRKARIRMALRLLFLSQGTPLLLSGDEFGNSQRGNNNAWCQDNEISWLDWKDRKRNAWIEEEVRALIAFRKAHPCFSREKAPRNTDSLALGFPDVSYHGSRAWKTEPEMSGRHLGIYYYGPYGKLPDGEPDRSFYAALNFSDEPQEFALPTPDKGLLWRPVSFGEESRAAVVKERRIAVTGPGTVEIFGTFSPKETGPEEQ